MKYIRKYVRFFENETMVKKDTKPQREFGEYSEETSSEEVVNRFEEIYKSLPSNEKKKIDSYFK